MTLVVIAPGAPLRKRHVSFLRRCITNVTWTSTSSKIACDSDDGAICAHYQGTYTFYVHDVRGRRGTVSRSVLQHHITSVQDRKTKMQETNERSVSQSPTT